MTWIFQIRFGLLFQGTERPAPGVPKIEAAIENRRRIDDIRLTVIGDRTRQAIAPALFKLMATRTRQRVVVRQAWVVEQFFTQGHAAGIKLNG